MRCHVALSAIAGAVLFSIPVHSQIAPGLPENPVQAAVVGTQNSNATAVPAQGGAPNASSAQTETKAEGSETVAEVAKPKPQPPQFGVGQHQKPCGLPSPSVLTRHSMR